MINLLIQDFQWIKEKGDDRNDHCAHGRVLFQINNTTFVKPEDGVWTVSASALYLLRTLSADHTIENPVSENNFLFPHCGFSVWPIGKRFKVLCMGCNSGIDVEVIHDQGMVTIRSDAGIEKVRESEWTKAVLGLVNSVQDFYRASSPKVFVEDDLDNKGWTAFWEEWKERYQHASLNDSKTG